MTKIPPLPFNRPTHGAPPEQYHRPFPTVSTSARENHHSTILMSQNTQSAGEMSFGQQTSQSERTSNEDPRRKSLRVHNNNHNQVTSPKNNSKYLV
jgi:hypothetical protein